MTDYVVHLRGGGSVPITADDNQVIGADQPESEGLGKCVCFYVTRPNARPADVDPKHSGSDCLLVARFRVKAVAGITKTHVDDTELGFGDGRQA